MDWTQVATVVLSGALGVAGVVVGARLTRGAMEAAEERRDRRDLKVAARVVEAALIKLDAVLVNVIKPSVTTTDALKRMVDDFVAEIDRAWLEHQAVLAAHLSAEDWDAVLFATTVRGDSEYRAWGEQISQARRVLRRYSEDA